MSTTDTPSPVRPPRFPPPAIPGVVYTLSKNGVKITSEEHGAYVGYLLIGLSVAEGPMSTVNELLSPFRYFCRLLVEGHEKYVTEKLFPHALARASMHGDYRTLARLIAIAAEFFNKDALDLLRTTSDRACSAVDECRKATIHLRSRIILKHIEDDIVLREKEEASA